MGRRIATRAVIALALLFMAMLLLSPVALADNCSSLYDCLQTTDAQTSVTVAVAVLVAVAIFALPQLLHPPSSRGEETPAGSEPPPPTEAERQALMRGEMGGAPGYPQAPGTNIPGAYPPHAQPGFDPAHPYQEGQWPGGGGPQGVGVGGQGPQGAYPQGPEAFPHHMENQGFQGAQGSYPPHQGPYSSPQGPADAQQGFAPQPQQGPQAMHVEGQGPAAEHLANRAQAGTGAEHAANRGEAGSEHLANRDAQGSQKNAPTHESAAGENRSDRPPSEIANRSNEPGVGQPAPSPSQPAGEPQIGRREAEVQIMRSDAAPQIARPEAPSQAVPSMPPPELAPQAAALLGLHHVTAIASDPRRNFLCYAGLLGLRLVKVTVDYDRPNAYQLYYGDALGNPGTVLCFTCLPNAPRGSRGAGQAISLAFSIPAGTLGFWSEYLTRNGITIGGPSTRFGDQVISFFDPDGVQVDLVAHTDARTNASWRSERIPTEAALRGLHSVSLSVSEYDNNAAMLQRMLGFSKTDEAGSRHRFRTGEGGPGAQLDLIHLPSVPDGTNGTGIIQHVSWRTPDETQQLIWQYALSNNQVNMSQVMDRLYYRALYFRIPGGTVFDIATDTPGFTVDEQPEQLGTRLMLPPWLEPQRQQLLNELPPLDLPTVGRG